MPIKFKCPQCQSIKEAPDSMAGTMAKCDCGQVLKLPASTASSAPAPTHANAIPVTCASCGKQHQAPATMAGQQAQCTCGNVLPVPHPSGSNANPPSGGDFFGGSDPFANNDPLGSTYPNNDPLGTPIGGDPLGASTNSPLQQQQPAYGSQSEDELLASYAGNSVSDNSQYLSAMAKSDDVYVTQRKSQLGTILGGVAMLVLGPIVFVIALCFDVIWPYPLILSLIGLFTIVKGLMGGGD